MTSVTPLLSQTPVCRFVSQRYKRPKNICQFDPPHFLCIFPFTTLPIHNLTQIESHIKYPAAHTPICISKEILDRTGCLTKTHTSVFIDKLHESARACMRFLRLHISSEPRWVCFFISTNLCFQCTLMDCYETQTHTKRTESQQSQCSACARGRRGKCVSDSFKSSVSSGEDRLVLTEYGK